jgi:hypothetical protein
MKIDDKGRILSFSEKPKGAELKGMVNLMFIVLLIINILQVSRTTQLILHHALASGYNCSRSFEGGSSRKTIHCFHGSVRLQEGDTS